MVQELFFDKDKDLQEVDQFGFVNLVDSVNNGYVPSDLVFNPDSFDGEEVDPESIIGKPHDIFEAMRMQESLANGIKEKAKKDKSEKS